MHPYCLPPEVDVCILREGRVFCHEVFFITYLLLALEVYNKLFIDSLGIMVVDTIKRHPLGFTQSKLSHSINLSFLLFTKVHFIKFVTTWHPFKRNLKVTLVTVLLPSSLSQFSPTCVPVYHLPSTWARAPCCSAPKGPVINYNEWGLHNGNMVGPKLFATPPPPQDRVKLVIPLLILNVCKLHH